MSPAVARRAPRRARWPGADPTSGDDPDRIVSMAESGLSLLLDGRALGAAGSRRGLGTYTRELVAGLSVSPRLDVSVLTPEDAELPAGVERLRLGQRGPDRWASAEHQVRLAIALNQARRRRAGAGRAQPLVFHSPAHDPPPTTGLPWVQTVADVLPLVRADAAFAVERRRWRRWSRRMRSADAVITFSRYSAAQIEDRLSLDPARVHVVPLAASSCYHPEGAPGERGGEPEPFVLSVGEYGPHKGYTELAGLAAALERAGLPHRVVVAGQTAPQWEAAREAELSSAGPEARRRIEVRGWVADLAALYRQAAVVVSSSRHEGFGLPLVEAMACGAPLVAFANTAVTEVVGSGGALVADGDVEALAEAVLRLLGDPLAADAARRAGLERSRRFQWNKTVAAHEAIYRSVAGLAGLDR